MVFTILLLRLEVKRLQRSRHSERDTQDFKQLKISVRNPAFALLVLLPWHRLRQDSCGDPLAEGAWSITSCCIWTQNLQSVSQDSAANNAAPSPAFTPSQPEVLLHRGGLKYRGCICLSAAARLLLLPLTLLCSLSTALTGNFGLFSEMKIIWSMLLHLPSHRLERMKPFRLASASALVISSPITSFLPLLPVQQHHYWKLRIYSSSFENMPSLSLTSIPALFEQQPTSCYLLIHLMKGPFALISSARVNWACIWTVLSLDPHFLTSNILFSLLTSAFAHSLYNCCVAITTLQERVFFMESDDPSR